MKNTPKFINAILIFTFIFAINFKAFTSDRISKNSESDNKELRIQNAVADESNENKVKEEKVIDDNEESNKQVVEKHIFQKKIGKIITEGSIKGQLGGGFKSKLSFKVPKGGKNKKFSDFKAKTDIMHLAYISGKFEYELPNFDYLIKSYIEIAMKSPGIGKDKQFGIGQAFVEIYKFKIGATSALFNNENDGLSQIQFLHSFDFGLDVAASLQYSSQESIFGDNDDISFGTDGRHDKIYTNFKLTKRNLMPFSLNLLTKYKFDRANISLCLLGKVFSYDLSENILEGSVTKKRKITSFAPAYGLNFKAAIKAIPNWTKITVGTVVGRGIGSDMSDVSNEYILKKEKDRKQYYSLVDNKVDIKISKLILLWGMRNYIKIQQNISKSFYLNLSYNWRAADYKFGNFFKKFLDVPETKETPEEKKKRETDTGAEKEHIVKGTIAYDLNGEGKLKIEGGVTYNILNDYPFSFALQLSLKML